MENADLPDVRVADAALARGQGRRTAWTALMALVDAAALSQVSALATAFAGPYLGLSASPMAAMAAGAAATVALHLKGAVGRWAQRVAMDMPGSRRLMQEVLDAVSHGTVATRRGGVWVLFEPGTPEPRVVSEREYLRVRHETGRLVEIEPTRQGVTVAYLSLGMLDSVVWGRPALEIHDLQGTRLGSGWYMGGERVSRLEVMRTREELGAPLPSP